MTDNKGFTLIELMITLCIIAILVVTLFTAVGSCTGATSVVTAPGRVINRTMETDNIIASYEEFFDLRAQYERRIGDIKTHEAFMAQTKDQSERNHLRIELGGMRSVCRDLAVRYNSQSLKINRRIFKDPAILRGRTALPERLDTVSCDGMR